LSRRVKLSDFGFSRVKDRSASHGYTKVGTVSVQSIVLVHLLH
jgi:hypothetical protein